MIAAVKYVNLFNTKRSVAAVELLIVFKISSDPEINRIHFERVSNIHSSQLKCYMVVWQALESHIMPNFRTPSSRKAIPQKIKLFKR